MFSASDSMFGERLGDGDHFDSHDTSATLGLRQQTRKDTRVSERLSISQFLNEGTPPVRDDEVSRAMRRRSANINIHRSLQALDEAVGTPASLRKRETKTPTKYRSATAAYTPLARPPRESLEVSAVFGRSSFHGSHLATPRRPQDESMQETRVAPYEDITTTNVALLLEEDPAMAVCSGLFTDFSNTMKCNGAPHQVFQLVMEYEGLCRDNAEQLNKLVKRAVPGQDKFTKTLGTLMQLTQEGCTWSLIASLYKDRLEHDMASEDMDEEPMMIDNLGKYQSEADIVKALYEKDIRIRQAQMVIDWLEKNARENLEVYHRVEFFTDQMGAWENSHHMLKQKRSGSSSGFDRPIVSELDPDAPIRQGKPLADLDVEDESRLLQHLFSFIRSGQLDEAQNLCVRVGQAWRAASLEGWRLYHDPNYEGSLPNGHPEKVKGNPHRDLWKNVCWKSSEEEKFDMYERAIYAVFCGHLKQLLTVCNTWEDNLWAHFRVLVDQNVEQQIRMSTKRPLIQLPPQYWEKSLTTEKIFNDIQANTDVDIQKQSKAHYHIIQKYIILGDIDRLIEEMYEWCKEDNRLPAHHLLRFMAHLVLFFRSIGISTKEELCVSILEAYVRFLIEDKQSHLVATYVAALPKSMQIEWYAKFLEGVEDTEARQNCLTHAEEAGLDIPNITKLVVENICKRDSDEGFDPDRPTEVSTSREDRQKIEAIDWLVFNPAQRAEALRQANAVMRSFLAVSKLPAAREVFNKIPSGSIDVIMKTCSMQTGSTTLRAEDDNAVREFLCHQAYLDAHDSFNDWFEHFHNAKPVKPHIPQGANFTERVAFEHKERQYEMDLARWKHNLMMQTKITKDRIYNVLLFVDGGWMIDQRTDTERDTSRNHQLLLIRQMCLPTLCFLLHTVLHGTEQYQECLQLADIITSEQHSLYKTFRRDELRQLLRKLRESSLRLLNSNLDPVGYPLQ